MLRTNPGFRSWVERVAQSYLWLFFPCSINYSRDQVQKLFWHTRTFHTHCWKIYSHKNLLILLDKGFFCPHILLSKSFSHLLLGQNNLLAGTFHSWIKLLPELVLRSWELGALSKISNKTPIDFPVSWTEPLLTAGRFLEELRWSCCFALSKANCFWWRNNQNICLFKWMVLRARTERQSPSLRLRGYSEPPINQHAGAASSVLEEMHSDLAYAHSGGITRGAQIVRALRLKAPHSACKRYRTEDTATQNAALLLAWPDCCCCFSVFLLFFFSFSFSQGTEWNPYDRYMLVQ